MFFLFFTLFLNSLIAYEARGQLGEDCGPNAIQLSIEQMCALVPDRGSGHRDIVRIYYNPVLQQCLPFSWSGLGGNANRFVSIKNCYEICHPSDPGVIKPTGSGLRTYLIREKPPKGMQKSCDKNKDQNEDMDNEIPKNKDVMIRQLKHPFDPSKTLTIVQPITYLAKNKENEENEKKKTEAKEEFPPKLVIQKHIRHFPVARAQQPQQIQQYSQFQPYYHQPQPQPSYQYQPYYQRNPMIQKYCPKNQQSRQYYQQNPQFQQYYQQSPQSQQYYQQSPQSQQYFQRNPQSQQYYQQSPQSQQNYQQSPQSQQNYASQQTPESQQYFGSPTPSTPK